MHERRSKEPTLWRVRCAKLPLDLRGVDVSIHKMHESVTSDIRFKRHRLFKHRFPIWCRTLQPLETSNGIHCGNILITKRISSYGTWDVEKLDIIFISQGERFYVRGNWNWSLFKLLTILFIISCFSCTIVDTFRIHLVVRERTFHN